MKKERLLELAGIINEEYTQNVELDKIAREVAKKLSRHWNMNDPETMDEYLKPFFDELRERVKLQLKHMEGPNAQLDF